MSKITADTITDEQIRELRHDIEALTKRALGEDGEFAESHPLVRKARARCAELVNATRGDR